MLFRVLKKSFDILWQNSVIIQPLILFMFLASILLGSANSFKSGFSPLLAVFGISAFALVGAFLAGWLQLFQAAIRNYSKEMTPEQRAEVSLASFREFLPAVGRFFVPVTVALLLFVLLFLGVLKVTDILGTKYIGFTQNISPDKLLNLFASNSDVYKFVESLSELDKKVLLSWDLLILGMTSLYFYITMFWFQAIMMNGENAFKGLWSSIKAVFARPFVTFGIFIFYGTLKLLVMIMASVVAANFLLQLLNLMFMIFIIVYFVMVNFVYFEEYSGNNIAGWTNIFR